MPKDFEAQTIEAGIGETGHRAHVDLGPVGRDAKVVISSTTMPQRIVDAHETERTARPYTGFLNLLKGCLGSGILGIPFAFSHTGWGLGLIILAVTAVASAYGLFLLFACAHKLGGADTSFSKLTAATYPWAPPIVDFLIILNCMGTAISYLVVIGENLSVLSTSVLGISSASFFSSPSFWKIIVFWGVVAPLGALKRLSMLKYSSIVGIVFIFYITLMNLVYAIAPFAEPCPEFSTAELHCGGTVVAFGNNGENILAAIPVFAFAFTCSENVFLVYNETRDPSVRRIRDLIGNPVAIVATVVFLITAMSTYFTFGDLTSGNLVLSYPSQDIAVAFANLAIVFIVTAGSPLKIHPARQSLTTLTCYFLSAGSWEDTREWCGGKFPKFIYVLNTSTVLISIFFTAMIITDLGVLFSIIGAVASTGLMFYIPGLAFFKLFAEDMPRERLNAEKTRSSVETKKADAGKADDRIFQPIFTYGWLRFHRWVALCLGILGLVVMVVSLVTIGLSSLPMLI